MLFEAIRNNAEWCDSVVRALGNAPVFRDAHWSNLSRSPNLYPNFITLTRQDTDKQLAAIEQLKSSGLGADWGVKDSFAALDLAPLGFRLLFDAQWFGVKAGTFSQADSDDKDWHFVEDAVTLDEWEEVWGETSSFFPPTLLDNTNIAFAFTRRGGAIAAGAVFNRQAGVCGFSNFFSPVDETAQFFPSAIAKAQAWSHGLPVVGYTSEAALRHLAFEGLEPLGPLRIWLFGS